MQIVKQDELFLLLFSQLPDKPRIVEVGGFTGNHTVKFIKEKPDAEIHVFEPVPSLFTQLQKNTVQFPTISCYQYAVSNEDRKKTLHMAFNPKKPNTVSPASSLHQPNRRTEFSPMTYTETIEVNCITLETWQKKYHISLPIDLLWIDAQGHELAILQGAVKLLPVIRFIHVEVHFNQAYQNGSDYTDVLNFLEKQNFTEIARDFAETKSWFFGNSLYKNNNPLF